jgi:hypothetical protein
MQHQMETRKRTGLLLILQFEVPTPLASEEGPFGIRLWQRNQQQRVGGAPR